MIYAPRMRCLGFGFGLGLVFLAACESPAREIPDAPPIDGYPDAMVDTRMMPFTTTGTTPIGTLDFVRFIGASYLDGFCPPGFYVDLQNTNEVYADRPNLTAWIPIAPPMVPTGRISTTLYLRMGIDNVVETDQAFFDVEHVDLPSGTAMQRVSGRVTAASDGWNVDFAIDLLTTQTTCI